MNLLRFKNFLKIKTFSKISKLSKLSKIKDMIIQKSNKGNSAVISQRYGSLKKQEYILNDQSKFAKDETLLNFAVNPKNVLTRFSKNLMSLKV